MPVPRTFAQQHCSAVPMTFNGGAIPSPSTGVAHMNEDDARGRVVIRSPSTSESAMAEQTSRARRTFMKRRSHPRVCGPRRRPTASVKARPSLQGPNAQNLPTTTFLLAHVKLPAQDQHYSYLIVLCIRSSVPACLKLVFQLYYCTTTHGITSSQVLQDTGANKRQTNPWPIPSRSPSRAFIFRLPPSFSS